MAQSSTTKANGNSAARLLELIQMRLIAEAIYVVAALGIPVCWQQHPKALRNSPRNTALYQAAGFELTRAIATTAPTGTTVIEGRPV